MNDENEEVTQTLTYLGSVFHSCTSCELEVSTDLGRTRSAMNFNEGSSFLHVGFLGLVLFLGDVDSDRRASTETGLLW